MVSNESAIVEMRLFSVDRYNHLPYEVPTGFTYRNLLGFARFPDDSTALVIISIVAVHSQGYVACSQQHSHDDCTPYLLRFITHSPLGGCYSSLYAALRCKWAELPLLGMNSLWCYRIR